jgi:NRPS condensation-like uncharacterized protein
VSRREALRFGPGRLPRSPFGLIDELNCYYDTPAEPNNIHLEVQMAGSLDDRALRQAVAGALAAAPRARGRMAAGGAFRRRYAWEFPPAPDVDPLSRATWSDEDELAAARVRFLASAPSLRASPPVRLLLASGPDASCVMLNAHHAAMDGMSSLELLRDIAARYRAIAGDPACPRPAPAQPASSTPASSAPASSTPTSSALASSVPASHVAPSGAPGSSAPASGGTPSGAPASSAPAGGGPADGASPNSAPPSTVPLNTTSPSLGAPSQGAPLPGPPARARIRALLSYPVARIAPERERRERPDGYGLRLLPVPGIPRAPGATVNDTLIAALIATISRWNAAHRPAPGVKTGAITDVKTGAITRAIRITVPVNVRDPGLRGVAGNHSRIATVTADPRTAAGDLSALLAEVTRQTSALRQAPRRRASAGTLGRAPGWCPVALKRLAVRFALRAIGRVVCDTCMLTNLGNVADPPWSGYHGPVRMSLSGPAHMPRGLSVAALTADGQLRLGFRYRYALFDDAAAARFTAAFAAALAELTSGTGPPRREEGDTSGSARGAAQDSRLPGRQRLPHVLRRREPAVQPAPEARLPD